MTSEPVLSDADKVRAIRRAASEGGEPGADAVASVTLPWGLPETLRIIELLMADMVSELDQSLRQANGRPYGLDAADFLAMHDALWQAKTRQ
jgi:hypothetical protein